MRARPGFSLLETIVVIALFMFVILTSGTIFIMSQRLYTRGADQGELIQNARVCLDRLSRELRQGVDIVTDLTSSTTPATEVEFQDGHDPSSITYIRYYRDGDDLKRQRAVYYLAIDPAVYVFHDSTDSFGQPAVRNVTEDRVVGEFFDSITFWNDDGLVTVDALLRKGMVDFPIDTKVYIRNW
jgi:type II secretory pathway pseudopilin PulG